ncbi:MFS transporter [Rhodobacteraceae bacterium XHP0102]|nr:MFS transporter [Rhodobacteraceae bacterium XHP0102]
MTDVLIDDRAAKRNVFVLILAQAFLGAQMPMIFVIGGLAGLMIAPSPALATIPISLIVFGSMTTAPWLSALMQRYGRKTGFIVGALGGAAGAAIASYGLYANHFLIFLLGSYVTGIYMSAHGFYRFAAADSASDDFRPRAISYVMAGGLLSALIGPQMVKLTTDATVVPFLGTYLSVVIINLIGLFLFFLLDLPQPKTQSADAPQARSRMELLRDPKIAVAVICGMVSYALMNLIMTSTPLAVVGCGFTTGTAADIVSAHVIAMYAPSFITGHIIARFGAVRVVALGLFLLALAGVVALMGVELTNFFIALILLGVGWNFGFIGATALLTQAHPAHERGRVQGLNDFLVFGGVTFASLFSGVLMSVGEGTVAGWNAVNIAMIPFLVLAGAALIWLVLRPSDEATA